jgi:hypothetical protein
MGRFTDHEKLLPLDIAAMEFPPNETSTEFLHVCPDCGSSLVQPTGWEQGDDRSHWRVWRRCPECEWTCDEVHGEREIDAFDEQLDLGANELLTELRALEHANMREMVDVFVAALSQDLIGADDFGRG